LFVETPPPFRTRHHSRPPYLDKPMQESLFPASTSSSLFLLRLSTFYHLPFPFLSEERPCPYELAVKLANFLVLDLPFRETNPPHHPALNYFLDPVFQAECTASICRGCCFRRSFPRQGPWVHALLVLDFPPPRDKNTLQCPTSGTLIPSMKTTPE